MKSQHRSYLLTGFGIGMYDRHQATIEEIKLEIFYHCQTLLWLGGGKWYHFWQLFSFNSKFRAGNLVFVSVLCCP